MTERIIASGNASWIPVPHTLDLVSTCHAPPADLTTAAFVIVFDAESRLLLTHVNLPGRSWDVPGGHIDPGEDAAESAARELAEETGFSLPPESLSLFGWQRYELHERPPTDYKYPYPLSYSVWYQAYTPLVAPPVSPDPQSECGPAEWCSDAEVVKRCGTCSWLPLYEFLLGEEPVRNA